MLRERVKAALPNTQKQTQGDHQIEETKKYGPKERTEKKPEKERNEMEIANLSDEEYKTLVIRRLRELTEYGKSIREEMKATLSEINKNPQRNNNERKEAGVQINNLEHKE